MNMKKILIACIVLLAIVSSLSFVSASDTILMGKVTNSEMNIDDASSSASEIKFDVNLEVDLSEMSDSDRKLLDAAIKDNDTALIINFTCGDSIKIAIWNYQAMKDISIENNTLYVKNHTDTYTLGTGVEANNLKISGMSLNTTKGQMFDAFV